MSNQINEVIERINLIIQCSGGRRISQENLNFLFDKYELTPEDRQSVLDYCAEQQIALFSETPESVEGEGKDSAKADQLASQTVSGQKKSFFARLFGR